MMNDFVPVSAQGSDAPVVAAFDVTFGRGGESDLALDLYRPASGEEKLPVVVFIHGGGWGGGEKELYRELAPRFASHGYLCAAISYRKAPRWRFPAALEDCKCAVRWLRAHAAEYGAAPDSIAVLGHSAGGHLAAMVALTPGQFEGEGGWPRESSAVQCAVCYCAPTELTVQSPPGLAGAITQFAGPLDPDEPGLRMQASPIAHVAGGAPPFLLVHGDLDDVVPIHHAERLAAALEEAGVSVELLRVRGAGHRLDLIGEGEAEPGGEAIFAASLAFLDKHLKQPEQQGTTSPAKAESA